MKVKIIAITLFIFLTISFSVLLYMFLKDNKENRQLYDKQEITININGEANVYTYEELSELVKPTEFKATYKPSNKQPIERIYTGIELRLLLESLGADFGNISKVVFKAGDGFQQVYSTQDIIKENNVFIAYLVNGKPFNKGIDSLAYQKEQEDGGPFVVIKAFDNVSQNRVKMLVEIKAES